MKKILIAVLVLFVMVGCDTNLSESTPTLSDKQGYWVKQGKWSSSISLGEFEMWTWVWKDGNIVNSWTDPITISDSLKKVRLKEAIKWIDWHKSIKDTAFKVE